MPERAAIAMDPRFRPGDDARELARRPASLLPASLLSAAPLSASLLSAFPLSDSPRLASPFSASPLRGGTRLQARSARQSGWGSEAAEWDGMVSTGTPCAALSLCYAIAAEPAR